MANSSRAKRQKPRLDFPLFHHGSGRWAKKIKGRFFYFGKVDGDANGVKAEALWNLQKDDLLAGREPQVTSTDAISIRDLCNRFLTAKRKKVNDDDLSERTWLDYHRVCKLLIKSFGRDRAAADVGPADFERLYDAFRERNGAHARFGFIVRVRSVFRYGTNTGLIPIRPERFGEDFTIPSRKRMRRERRKKGPKHFKAAEIRGMLKAAPADLRAMILLGINCGYGNADCGNLTLGEIDLEAGWATLTRSKTEIDRRCPLWPETIAAVREALAGRPRPSTSAVADHVFLSPTGLTLNNSPTANPVSRRMGELLKRLGMSRPSVGFYSLRKTFATVGLQVKDRDAVRSLMGHEAGDMLNFYDETGPGDERLRAVTDHVRGWLWPKGWEKLDSQPEAAQSL